MNQFNLKTRQVLAAMVMAVPGMLFAGNVPQYTFSKGGEQYAEITDGIEIPYTWPGGTQILWPNEDMPGGYLASPNSNKAPGYPIGFDFKFAGTTVNQFAVGTAGSIYLGKDVVSAGGGTELFFVGMMPVKHGLQSGKLSYKTTGDEGNRMLTMQFANCKIADGTNYGKFDLQIRLYEADGKIELAFHQIDPSNNGFNTGITGWTVDDGIRLTANGIDSKLSLSPWKNGNMLEKDSYIAWDIDDYQTEYTPTIAFMPCSDKTAPAGAPKNLTVTQNGSTLNISVERAAESPATVVLVSDKPFTDDDMPVDGETFPVGQEFGNAVSLAYNDQDMIKVSYPDVLPGVKYYVRALSVNGYPAYNRQNVSEVAYVTPQGAPTMLRAEAESTKRISFDVASEHSVIVATSTTPAPGYEVGYKGVFGHPSADVKVGDELVGGGKVVYVGEPAHVEIDAEPNTLTFLRAWSLNEGIVSSTSIDAYACPSPSFPYIPRLENYPQGLDLNVWSSTPNQYVPRDRTTNDVAICARTYDYEAATLYSPVLPLDCPTKLTFEFALETLKDFASTPDSGEVEVPQGSEPGWFGDKGYLKVMADGKDLLTISNYNGTMTPNGTGGYNDGTSTFEEKSIEIPAIGNNEVISFVFSCEKTSKLYIRNIRLEATGAAPVKVATITLDKSEAELEPGQKLQLSATVAPADAADPTVEWKSSNPDVATVSFKGEVTGVAKGEAIITAYAIDGGDARATCKVKVTDGSFVEKIEAIDSEKTLEVYTLMGVKVNVKSKSELKPGFYIINGQKWVIR